MTNQESIAFLREVQKKIESMSDSEFEKRFEESGAADLLRRYDAKIKAEARERYCKYICSPPDGECGVNICHDEMAILGIGVYRERKIEEASS